MAGLTKKCTWCLNVKPITEFSFRGVNPRTKEHERRNYCKSCCKRKKDLKNVFEVSEPVVLNSNGNSIQANTILPEVKKDYENIYLIQSLSNALLNVIRYDSDRLSDIDEKSFYQKVNYKGSTELYNRVISLSVDTLCQMGKMNEKSIALKEDGTYLVVGESFGKHCKTGMFDLLSTIDNHYEFNNIIHLGHALDDDGDLSHHWKRFKGRCIFVGKPEELETLHQHEKEFDFELIKDFVKIGDTVCKNQEQISAYSKQPVNALDQYIYNENTIVNFTRHEYFQRNSYGYVFIAGTGTLAEPFVLETIKQVDFTDGYKVKECYSSSFSKYRKMQEDIFYWQNGAYIIKISGGITYVKPIRIKKVNNMYVTCIDGLFYGSNKKTWAPSKRIAVLADAHIPNESISAVNLALNILSVTEFNAIAFLGDIADGRSVNPHILKRGEIPTGDMLGEIRYICTFFKNFDKYKVNKFLVEGNHEDFYKRFSDKFPSLNQLFYNIFKSIYEQYDIVNVAANEHIVHIEDCSFIHGSDQMIGQYGRNVYDKVAKTYPTSTKVMGHTHRPAIFRDVYSIGCLAEMDQGYNSPNSSNWMNGISFVNFYKGVSFVELVNFQNIDGEFYCDYNNYVHSSADLNIEESCENSLELSLI